MILLDTNILSELMRPVPAPAAAVEQWLADQPETSVFLSSITQAELRYGAKIMPPDNRQAVLAAEIESMIREDFGGRIQTVECLVTDDGRSINPKPGRGMRITRALARELGGRVDWHFSQSGTTAQMHFPCGQHASKLAALLAR